jgi:hypothetical protein
MVSAQVLGPEGKKVKCSSCEEVWFQMPDEEALAELGGVEEVQDAQDTPDTPAEEPNSQDDIDSMFDNVPSDASDDFEIDVEDSEPIAEGIDPFQGDRDDETQQAGLEPDAQDGGMEDDIPSAIKPDAQNAPDIDFLDQAPKNRVLHFIECFIREPITPARRMGGYLLVLLVFVASIFWFWANQKALIKDYPLLAGAFYALGLEPDIAGQGLLLDDVVAEIEDDKFRVRGEIVNLSLEDKDLPVILAVIESTRFDAPKQWVLELEEEMVPAEKILPFEAVYPVEKLEGGESFTLKFVLNAPSALEAVPGENKVDTHAQEKQGGHGASTHH